MQQEIKSSGNEITDSSNDMSLLIVDDEQNLRNQLAKAMERRGFIVSTAESVSEGKQLAVDNCPKYAVVDLRLPSLSTNTVIAPCWFSYMVIILL